MSFHRLSITGLGQSNEMGRFRSTGILATLCLILQTVVTDIELPSDESAIANDRNNLTNVESSETISSLNSWVKIPEGWKQSYGDEDTSSSTSSEGFSPPSSAESRSDGGGRRLGSEEARNEPFFDHAMMTNLSEQVESHVFLRCRVKNLGDRTVSWIRRRDWHILTSGRIVYTNDDRFKIKHVDGSDEWTLVIEYVQTRDSGTYECQISTGRGTMSHFFNLNILVPQAYILGAKEYHVQQGTVISLVCIVENSPRQSAQYLYWYHNNQMVNYGTGVSVHTEPGVHTHSRLTVPSAGFQHAGNYTCKASNTIPASVQVYVSEGDKTAAIQRQTGSRFVPPWWTAVAEFLLLSSLHSHFLF